MALGETLWSHAGLLILSPDRRKSVPYVYGDEPIRIVRLLDDFVRSPCTWG